MSDHRVEKGFGHTVKSLSVAFMGGVAALVVLSCGSGLSGLNDQQDQSQVTIQVVMGDDPQTGSEANSRGLAEDTNILSIKVEAWRDLDGSHLASANLVDAGSTWTGTIDPGAAPGLVRFMAYAFSGPNGTGNYLYSGEASVSVPSATSVLITLASWTPLLPVDLKTAGYDSVTLRDFIILAKTLISSTSGSVLTGDLGVSPAAATFIQGFDLTLVGDHSTSAMVTGKLYAADYAVPTPDNMTQSVLDMEAAYTDAAGRTLPDFNNLGAGEIGSLTLVPGLYKYTTGLGISTNVTLAGGANDVWIFQVSGNLTVASGISVLLANGALPKNIFWQVAGNVALNSTSHFEGVVLSAQGTALVTGATVNGRLLSQTAVTLQSNTITKPAH